MNTLRSTLHACIVVVIFSFTAPLAQGQGAVRTWVSGVGDDVNPCSRTAPCKTFAGAISKTATGGEISALDPGGFGTVTITKSITIDAIGIGSIIAGQANGITINITNPADAAKSVRIRGVSINGLGTGNNGISVVAANQVSIEETVIDGFTNNGVDVAMGTVFIDNTVIRNNTNIGLNVALGAQAGISDVSLVFNGDSAEGPITRFNDNVIFGNKNQIPQQRRRR